jgi:hypothetical protein
MTADLRKVSPSVARNRDPIWTVLQRYLPTHGVVLELASGSGEHVSYFSQLAPRGVIFQPSDPDADARHSIDAWSKSGAGSNVRPALALDAASDGWPIAHADAVICINMIHISPWTATLGLLAGSARILPTDGVLYLYGPYRQGGVHTAESNAVFDLDLKVRDPAWGVRDLEEVTAAAMREHFLLPEIVPMPANNLSVIFRRAAKT